MNTLITDYNNFVYYSYDGKKLNMNEFLNNHFHSLYEQKHQNDEFEGYDDTDFSKYNRFVYRTLAYNRNELIAYKNNILNYQQYNKIIVSKERFSSLITKYGITFLPNTNVNYSLNSVIKKLTHFISYFYSNDDIYNTMKKRYPFKVIFEYNDVVTRVFIVNNKIQLKEMFIKLYFNIMETLNSIEAGGDSEYIGQSGSEISQNTEKLHDDNDDTHETLKNNFDYQAIKKINITFIEYTNHNGQLMPYKLKLPNNLAKSVICPNNKDTYCLIWNILINKFLIHTDVVKKVTNKLSFNYIEKFPILQEKFDIYKPKFDILYENGEFELTYDNIKKLERIFEININIYTYLDVSEEKFDIFYRSDFKNSGNKILARIVYVPYSIMEKSKTAYKIDEYTRKSYESLLFDSEYSDFFSDNKGHYCSLTSSCKFLFVADTDTSTKDMVCVFCDMQFSAESTLLKHSNNCEKLILGDDIDRLITYENNVKDAVIEFKNYHFLTKSPFIIYSDTETRTDSDGHKLFSYMLYLKSEHDSNLDKFILRTATKEEDVGENMCIKFINDLTYLRYYISKNANQYRILNLDEKKIFEDNNEKIECLFCKTQTKDLVVHHSHDKKSNNIIGYLCYSCNKKEANVYHQYSIVFHNLAYDLLVLIKSLALTDVKFTYSGEEFSLKLKNNFDILAKSGMKYSSLTIKYEKVTMKSDFREIDGYLPAIKFIDSFAFVNMSLSNIIKTMKMGIKSDDLKNIFTNTYRFLMNKYKSEELFSYATKKGLIAYAHTTIDNMKSKSNLPIEKYKNDLNINDEFIDNLKDTNEVKYNRLNDNRKKINDGLIKSYSRCNEIYSILEKITPDMNYQVYFEFYLELDILLLSDFFEFLRNKLFLSHKLDLSYCMGLPGYSQQCMLYLTKKQLHLIEDASISRLINLNIRGGFSGIVNKISENFEKNPKKIIKIIDVNNLYAIGMQNQKLANKFIKEMMPLEFDVEKDKYHNDGSFCYFLLTDYTIPEHIHDKLSVLPPLISKKIITSSDLSNDQKKIKVIKNSYKSEKLCSSLEPGTDYLMDYKNYLFYEKLGYKITIKRVFKFKQEFIMKEFIELNTALRQKCSNELEKSMYKLINNSCFGKSIQNSTKYSEIEINAEKSIIKKRMKNPLLKRVDIIVENKLVLTDLHKSRLRYDTCLQSGFSILEAAKLHIYSALYNKLLPFYNKHNIDFKLLMTDTDSILYELDISKSKFNNEIEMMIAFKDSKYSKDLFDLHKYSDKTVKDTSRKKEVGLFLDEYSDIFEIVGYIGLCSKSYCYLIEKKLDVNIGDKDLDKLKIGERYLNIRGKGVNNKYLEALYNFDDYKAVLEGNLVDDTIKFNNIQKKNFSNIINSIEKKTLSSFDDKFFNYIDNENNYKSLPYGHYKINAIKSQNKPDLKKDEKIIEIPNHEEFKKIL